MYIANRKPDYYGADEVRAGAGPDILLLAPIEIHIGQNSDPVAFPSDAAIGNIGDLRTQFAFGLVSDSKIVSCLVTICPRLQRFNLSRCFDVAIRHFVDFTQVQ